MSTPALAFPKPSRLKSPAYLAWLKAQQCLICTLKAEPDHTKTRATGGSDYRALPFCAKHHRQRHNLGVLSFQKKFSIDFMGEARRPNLFFEAHACLFYRSKA